jgi:hypothetical protein
MMTFLLSQHSSGKAISRSHSCRHSFSARRLPVLAFLSVLVLSHIFFLFICLLPSASLRAQTNLRLGGGVALAPSVVSAQSLLNLSSLSTPSGVLQLVSDSRLTGWHAAGRLMVGLGDQIGFTVAGAYHRFSDLRVNIVDPAQPSVSLDELSLAQTIVPLSAGLELTLFRFGIGVYVAGDLNFNFISSSAQAIPTNLVNAGLMLRDTYSRVGGNVGLGVDLSLFGVGVDVCARYNHANLIGRNPGEAEQTFFTLTASILLGSKTKPPQ